MPEGTGLTFWEGRRKLELLLNPLLYSRAWLFLEASSDIQLSILEWACLFRADPSLAAARSSSTYFGLKSRITWPYISNKIIQLSRQISNITKNQEEDVMTKEQKCQKKLCLFYIKWAKVWNLLHIYNTHNFCLHCLPLEK